MSTTGKPGAPAGVADDFVAALQDGDLDRAFGAVSPSAEVVIHPTGQAGGPEIARDFFREARAAFGDLMLTVTRRTACGHGRVLVELSLKGTQAADFLGAINQEKHLDIEQAWLFTIQAGVITANTTFTPWLACAPTTPAFTTCPSRSGAGQGRRESRLLPRPPAALRPDGRRGRHRAARSLPRGKPACSKIRKPPPGSRGTTSEG